MQKDHCLISNIENLVAKIWSVKFSFLLSIFDSAHVLEYGTVKRGLNAFAKNFDSCQPALCAQTDKSRIFSLPLKLLCVKG